MKTKKKTQWGSISMLLLLFMISSSLQPIIFKSFDLQAPNNNENDRKLKETVTTTDYSPDFTGNGEDCNVTLQQSLIDSSPIKILNSSDPLNNTLYEPCPTTENFPSSFVNITMEDIYAPNKTLILESHSGFPDYDYDLDNAKTKATSFKIKGNSYLNNVSIYLNNEGSEAIVYVYLFNSTWYEDGVNSRSIPDGGPIGGKSLGTITVPASTFDWYYLDGLNEELINSKTDNNTWFIGLLTTGSYNNGWLWKLDTDGSNTHSVWYNISALPRWQTELYDSTTIDYYLDVTLSPYISPPNHHLIVEDSSRYGDEDFTNTDPCATSFIIPGNLFLENISVHLTNSLRENATIRMVLYNSTWISGRSEPGGADAYEYLTLAIFDYPNETFGWYSVTGLHVFLNNSKTENNTWFIGLFDIGVGISNAWWGYSRDDDSSGGDNVDETLSYTYDSVNFIWELTQNNVFPACSVDFLLTMDLIPENNIPKPENINLRINNSIVFSQPNKYGIGYWASTNEYLSSSGFLGFTISADWWDVACTITVVEITYTKTDVKANANFTVVGSGQVVLWNVTDNEGLNYLDSRINEATTINFTIPCSWNNINVFNGTINKTDDISFRSLNNGYSEICVLNAGSGNWFLTASSANLLESINSYNGSIAESTFNYSNIVHFNASFKETIFQNDGSLNLSIYSPALINDVLNFTLDKTVFDTGQEISLGDWDVSDTVTQYGVFRVQMSWFNKTAVGFIEDSLTIFGESQLVLIKPPQNAIYNPIQQFEIIVYYEDSHLNRAIGGAVIGYNIADQGWETTTIDNGTTGFYLIPVDCGDLSSSGLKHVEIAATHDFYSTPTLKYMFEIRESTSTTTTTTTTTTIQPETSTSTTTTTTKTITETGTFPGVVTVFAVFCTLVIFIQRRKKM